MRPEKFAPLDPVIHSQVRLAALSILVAVKNADFNFLKRTIDTSDGNLSVHLSKLEEAGYITIIKRFKGKKPLTLCSITTKGREAFAKYVRALETYLP
jgi:DNA-binding transcriptional ArsR family regulator